MMTDQELEICYCSIHRHYQIELFFSKKSAKSMDASSPSELIFQPISITNLASPTDEQICWAIQRK